MVRHSACPLVKAPQLCAECIIHSKRNSHQGPRAPQAPADIPSSHHAHCPPSHVPSPPAASPHLCHFSCSLLPTLTLEKAPEAEKVSSVPLCHQVSGQCPARGRCTGKVDDDTKTPQQTRWGVGAANLADVISESHEGPSRNQEEC